MIAVTTTGDRAMKRILLLLPLLLLTAACSTEDDPVVPPGPDGYTALGDFHNLLVGDGAIDTRASFRQGTDVALGDHILPNGAALGRTLLLDSPAQADALTFFLTEGDGTVLNRGEVFNLNNTGEFVFLALGDVRMTDGQTRPTLLQMDALAPPPADRVRLRFSHALTGWTGAVDVHVDGEVLADVRYGHEFAPVTFFARAAGQDSLVVVPAGEDPDGPYVLWEARGEDLFAGGNAYEAFLVHEPFQSVHGDIAGAYEVVFRAP